MITREAWRETCEHELGKPYVWGAEGPEAYDCSGFAQWALALLGLDPPGVQTAEGLYRYFKRGRALGVSLQNADLGDLVFFGTDQAITHVALAWRGGKMLEAGGGGRATASAAVAEKIGAKVRIRSVDQRKDLVEILRPRALAWHLEQPAAALEATGSRGHFEHAPPLTEWLEDGRHMRLKRPFGFVQESGREWSVPAETVVDGASIPRVFWSMIGGPFEGRYRVASIVHDYYCDVQTRAWQDTHGVFYDAMLCSGVAKLQAKVMYYAVYRFGPRWTQGSVLAVDGFEAATTAQSVATLLPSEPFDAASFEEDAKLIGSTDPDLSVIEAMADARVPGSADDTTALASIAAQADAAAIRRPLIERLVELQDAATDEPSAGAVGALLSRYSALSRSTASAGEFEAAPPFEVLKPRYEALYATCQVRAEHKAVVAWHLKKLLQYRPRYEAVAARTEAPWWFIGVVHALEASFNFKAHLHNGDPLAGRTVQVPKGRPAVWNPPNDWESSAIDAITFDKLAGVKDWSLASTLYRWERFNGFGYYPHGTNSPYLWSFSNHYEKGKFVKDGFFDAEAISKQCGAAVMLHAMEDADAVNLD